MHCGVQTWRLLSRLFDAQKLLRRAQSLLPIEVAIWMAATREQKRKMGLPCCRTDNLMSLGSSCTLTLPYGAEVEASCTRADFVFLFAWCHCRAQRYTLSSHCRYFGVEPPIAPSTRCFCFHRLAKSGYERQCKNEYHAEQFELMAEIRNSCSIFRSSS